MRVSAPGRAGGVLALIMVPLALGACSRTAATVGAAGAAAAAAIGYNDRGTTTKVDATVARVADATERAFRDQGIVFTEREVEDDGIEIKGAEGDWKVVVDIERDPGDALTSMEVTVSKDQINYEKSRSEEIVRAILARVR